MEICYFSLEQAGTIMREDPFLSIKFGPPNLFGTKLLYTMFSSDYKLKWFINLNEAARKKLQEAARKDAKETADEFTVYEPPIDIDKFPESFKVCLSVRFIKAL